MSITTRLILSLTLFTGFLWGVAAFSSRTVFVSEFDEIISENMATTAQRMMPLILNMIGDSGEHSELELEEDDDDFEEGGGTGTLAFEVRTNSGQLILKSRDAGQFALPGKHRAGYVQTPKLLAYTLLDRRSGLTLTVFEPTEHRAEAIAEATWALFLPLLFLMPVMAVLILVIVRFAMSPIKLLGQEIAARGGNDLSRLNSSAQPKELQPIAGAIDRLLDRLRAALDAERIVAANSAHELRTPVAGALAQTQQLKEELKSGPGHERVAQIEATLRKLADFTEKLLQLSRASAGVGSTTERQNLSPVLQAIIDEFRGRKLRPVEILVQDELGQDLQVAMDPDAFAIVLRNLIENAALHGTPGRPITSQNRR